MKKVLNYLLMGAVLVSITSCGTLLSKSKQEIMFKGTPQSELYDGHVQIGTIAKNGFATIPIKKGRSTKTITAKLDGYEDRSVLVPTKFNPPVLWNLVLGGLPGVLIDFATGKVCKYKDKTYDISLTEGRSQYVYEDAGTGNQQRVTRNAPGKTDLEKTIIRWNFDSDPRGCRIFWRVISSVPDEVKNTNETYLTTTPYEETRSFNILGLTYENSRDVTIEIKVTKRGYEDQVKRYNVRQAIDQQEISGFFELVPKEQ